MPGFKISTQGCSESSASNGPNPNIETARKHRYKFEIIEPLEKIKLYAWKCTRPTMEVDKIVVHHRQNEIEVPGKHRWLPVDITFYEIVNEYNDTASYINLWYAKSVILAQSSRTGSQSDFKKTCQLDLLDGQGETIWSYKLYDVWPIKVEPSELSYAESGIADTVVTLAVGAAEEGV